MVTIYPMLVSQAVSENIIPGIAKTLESYIIVYNMEDVISHPGGPRQVNYKIKSGRIFAKEATSFPVATTGGSGPPTRGSRPSTRGGIPPGVGPGTGGKKPQIPSQPPSQTQPPVEIKKAGKAKAKITSSDFKSITLEPSYMTVEITKADGSSGTEFIGVKVVPLRVKSDSKLLDMLMYDHQMRAFQAAMVSQGRNILRFAYKIIDKWTGRLSARVPTGDVRRDAVLSRTGFRGKPFIVVDKGQDFDESFFSKPSRINRLFKMGWGNIVIVDSINRQAYFCLKKLRGTCSIISFSMIYQNLGQLKVYETLEDAKRQNSSLFKVGPKMSKVLGECMSEIKQDHYNLSEGKKMDKIDTYLEHLDMIKELELVTEVDLKALASKLVPDVKLKSIVSKLKSSFDFKKPEKIVKAAKATKFPVVKPGVMDKFIGGKVPLYKKNKAAAKVILKNSLGKAKDTSIDAAASFVALQSLFKKKGEKDDPKRILKKNITAFVTKARKFQSEYESLPEGKQPIPKEAMADYVVGATIIVLGLGFVVVIGGGLYVVMSAVASLIFPGLLIAFGILLVVYGAVFVLGSVLGGGPV